MVVGCGPTCKGSPGTTSNAELPRDRPKKIGSTTDWPKNWICASRCQLSSCDTVDSEEGSTGGRVTSPTRAEASDWVR